jgi:hypothetical protein
MRTILRVGITIGGIAFVALYALQSAIALAIAPGIIVAGVCAGLGTAKWLERPWFGRQFSAGLRTGIIAVGMAGVGALLALLTQGPHSIDQLTERSHLFPIDLGPAITMVSGIGWVGVDILVVSLSVAVGIAVSVVISQIGAWTKSQRAIQVVAQARLAAQGSVYDDRAGVSGTFGNAGTPVSTPARVGPPPRQDDSISPFGDQPWDQRSWDQPFVPPVTSTRFQESGPTPKESAQRRPSKARPAETQLNEAMREALATWAGDATAAAPADPSLGSAEGARVRTPQPSNYPNSAPPTPAKRAPLPSEYLNSSPPAGGKRARKKQNTEWLR